MVKFLEEIDPLSFEGEKLTKEEYEAKDQEEDEDISYDELKKRTWKDRMRMQKLKSQKSNIITSSEDHDDHDQPETSSSTSWARLEDASRRKKMARAQDAILKYMVKIMEVCKAKGFVYGIIPEKGKLVTGSSDR